MAPPRQNAVDGTHESVPNDVKLPHMVVGGMIKSGRVRKRQGTWVSRRAAPQVVRDKSAVSALLLLVVAVLSGVARGAPTITALSLPDSSNGGLLLTEGGERIFIDGTDFGPASADLVTVTYGGAGSDDFTATGCTVTTENTRITCTDSAEGYGTGHRVKVTATTGTGTSAVDVTLAYAPPTVDSASGPVGGLDTRGGDVVTLTGTNFGPDVAGNGLSVTSGADGVALGSSSCSIDSHTQISCSAPPGAGVSLWRVTVGGQSDILPVGQALSYAAPSISGITGVGVGDGFGADGGDTATIEGDMFGAVGAGFDISATYGPSGTEFTAVNCQVTRSHDRITCEAAVGTGFDHSWIITVEGSSSPESDVLTKYKLPVILSVTASALVTGGGGTVTITGSDFGPDESWNPVSATYGADGTGFAAQGCSITAANTMSCTSIAGAGSAHQWIVSVGGQQSAASGESQTTSYALPSISGVSDGASQSVSSMLTSGGADIVVSGSNFGPLGSSVAITYGPSGDSSLYSAAACSVTSAHSEITCTSAAGFGAALRLLVTVEGQTSAAETGSGVTLSYATPSISDVADGASQSISSMSTSGGADIVVSGSNFGPAGTPVALTYGPSGSAGTFTASGCTVTAEHIEITCTAAAGSGSNLRLVVSVDGIASAESGSGAVVSYGLPSITSVADGSTQAVSSMLTSGGADIVVSGSNFGPSGTSVTLTYGPSGSAGTYTASGCSVTDEHVEVTCTSVPGSGSDLRLLVTIDGQASESETGSGAAVSYGVPSISGVADGVSQSVSSMLTPGGADIVVSGTNFGPIGTPVLVTYGPSGDADRYSGANCAVTDAHVEITCTSAAGYGASLRLLVTVDGQPSAAETGSGVVVSYGLPSISTVADGASQSVSAMLTSGGADIVVSGSNFGPSDTPVAVSYGPSGDADKYIATACTVTDSHVQITCTSIAGSGAALRLLVTVGDQDSLTETGSGVVVSYGLPSISAVADGASQSVSAMLTSGGADIVVSGTNFGPSGTPVGVTYGPSGSAERYSASGCSVTVDHSEITCTSVAGVGGGLRLLATVDGQSSASQTGAGIVVGYNAPSIDSVSASVGLTNLPTQGGTVVTLIGSDFGPDSIFNTVSATYGPFTAQNCAVDSANEHTRVTCETEAGAGEDYAWTLNVGGQASLASSDLVSYAQPAITSLAPANTGATPTMSDFLTSGSQDVLISGTNFGPDDSFLGTVTYGSYTASGCTIEDPHVEMRCTTVAGVGAGHTFTATVGGRTSAASVGSLSYAAPEIDDIIAPAGMSTTGGEQVALVGSNFGPAGTTFTVTYGSSDPFNTYTAQDCVLATPHSRIECDTTVGVGEGLRWRISNLGGQSSGASATTTYQQSAISGLSGGDMDTTGGTEVTINGNGFGPVSTDVTATYGPTGVEFSATGQCTVQIADTEVVCTAAEGAGAGLAWRLTVAGVVGEVSSVTNDYEAPQVTGVEGLAAVDASDLDTVGGETIRIQGSSFGPAGTSVSAVYFSEADGLMTYSASGCTVFTADVEIRCTTVVGVGGGLKLRVTSAGQEGPVNDAVTLSYASPTIIGLAGGDSLDTQGGESVTISGTSFGPVGTHSSLLVATYDNAWIPSPLVATNCAVTTAHIELTCTSAVGVGAGHRWTVEIGGQSSEESPAHVTSSYTVPTIGSFSAVSSAMNTDGGEEIIITGTDFGPEGLYTVSAEYGPAGGPYVYTASSCDVVGENHDTISCLTAAGVGRNHVWRVNVGDQNSAESSDLTHYGPPSISGVALDSGVSMDTRGGEVVTISGSNFGPPGADNIDVVTYGSFTATSCTVQAGSTQISCLTSEGTGGNLDWSVEIAGQTSSESGRSLSYSLPVISDVSDDTASAVDAMATEGGDTTIVVTGDFFGPTGTGVSISYGPNGVATRYSASACSVTVAHTEIRCTSVAGVGASLRLLAVVNGQSSSSQTSGAIVVSYNAPSIDSVSAPVGLTNLPTQGGTVVTLIGNDFGPDSIFNTVSATYGPFTAQNCAVDSANEHTRVTCETEAGAGEDYAWTLNVGGQASSASSDLVSYAQPAITSLAPANTGATPTMSDFLTSGSQDVLISGTDFGPDDSFLGTVTYGSYTASGCTIEDPHVEIRCTTVEGVGAGHTFTVTVGGRTSAASVGSLSFGRPSISSLSLDDMSTAGGQEITLTGVNFGPEATPVVVVYGTDDDDNERYTAVNCDVSTAHTQVTCDTVAGIGVSLKWKATVASQTGAASVDSNSYGKPTVTSIVAGAVISTLGTDTVSLQGTNFGPTGSVVSAVYRSSTGVEFDVGPCTLDSPHTDITCPTLPGAGTGLSWILEVGGRTGDPSTETNRYEQATVSSVVVPAGDANRLDTRGGELVRLVGTHFGPTGTDVDADYFDDGGTPSFAATSCAITTVDANVQETIECQTVAGVGDELRWRVDAGGQTGVESGAGVSVSYEAPVITNVFLDDTAFPTNGGAIVRVVGDYFGPSGASFAPSASYGIDASPYSASCTVSFSAPHTEMTCTTVAGSGGGHTWIVSVGGQSSAESTATTAYDVGEIASFGGSPFTTDGGDIINLIGNNFGPTSTDVSATYGPADDTGRYAADCSVLIAHSIMQCTTAAGVGANHVWVLTVDGQVSPASTSTTSYLVPAISGVSTAAAGDGDLLNTAGGAVVVVAGSNFGPAGSGNIDSVQYGPYVATSCSVEAPGHTEIRCTSIEGIGTGHDFVVTIDGQASNTAGFSLSYSPPSIASITSNGPEGLDDLPTVGGVEFEVQGDNFGPVGTTVGVRIGRADPWDEHVASNCAVTTPHVILTCDAPEGINVGHQAVVVVGTPADEQVSAESTETFSYQKPSISGISASPINVDEIPTDPSVTNTPADLDDRVWIIVTGENFGPVLLETPSASYGAYAAETCEVTVPHTEIRCLPDSNGGTGSGHELIVTVGGQDSEESGFEVSYGKPAVVRIIRTDGDEIDAIATLGGIEVEIDGVNFGATTTTLELVTYGGGVYDITSSCSMETPHSRLHCDVAAGVGRDHALVVRVDGQDSDPSTTLMSYAPPIFASILPERLETAGGETFTIAGGNFGPDTPGNVVTVTYGSYTANNCVLTTPHTAIECESVVGAGGDLALSITAGGQTSAPSASSVISYQLSEITSVTTILPLSGDLSTRGGATLELVGTNFGPGPVSTIQVRYGATPDDESSFFYDMVNCELRVAHTTVRCDTAPGVGTNMSFILSAAGQWGAVSVPPAVISYVPPRLDSVNAPALLLTSGGEEVVITGDEFGPVGLADITAVYGGFETGFCQVTVAYTEVTCSTAEGYGQTLAWQLDVGGQATEVSSVVSSYFPPSILDVQPTAMQTAGNQQIVITGLNLGPLVPATPVSAVYGVVDSGFVQPEFTSPDCWVSAAHVEVTCLNAAGDGTGYQWEVNVGGQSSDPSDTVTDYNPPHITSLSVDVGPIQGATEVVVHGTNFGRTGSVSIEMADASSTVIECEVDDPEDLYTHWNVTCVTTPAPSADPGVVIVESNGQDSSLTGSDLAFHFYDFGTINPKIGPVVGGTKVTIDGSGFHRPDGDVRVAFDSRSDFFDGSFVPATLVSDTEVEFITEPTAGGGGASRVYLSLAHQFNSISEMPDQFVFYPLPVVTSTSPQSGPVSGGTVIEVSGEFSDTGSAFMQLGDIEFACTYESDVLLTCVTPAGLDAGVYNCEISLDDGVYTVPRNYRSDGVVFQIYDEPEVLYVHPPLGLLDNDFVRVVVYSDGDAFVPTLDGIVIFVGSTQLDPISTVTEDKFQLLIPNTIASGVAGAHDISISLNGGHQFYISSTFTFYELGPIVVSPTFGPREGTTNLEVTGSGFVAPYHDFEQYVFLDFVPVAGGDTITMEATVESSSLITAQTPSSSEGHPIGDYAVFYVLDRTVDDGGEVHGNPSPDNSTFFFYDTPTLASVSPTFGPASGGTSVILTGAFFETFNARATFWEEGGASVDCLMVSDTEIRCVTPEVSAGLAIVNVTVDTADTVDRMYSDELVTFFFHEAPLSSEGAMRTSGDTITIGLAPTLSIFLDASALVAHIATPLHSVRVAFGDYVVPAITDGATSAAIQENVATLDVPAEASLPTAAFIITNVAESPLAVDTTCTSWRVWYEDGLLPHWTVPESCNGQSAELFVRIPSAVLAENGGAAPRLRISAADDLSVLTSNTQDAAGVDVFDFFDDTRVRNKDDSFEFRQPTYSDKVSGARVTLIGKGTADFGTPPRANTPLTRDLVLEMRWDDASTLIQDENVTRFVMFSASNSAMYLRSAPGADQVYVEWGQPVADASPTGDQFLRLRSAISEEDVYLDCREPENQLRLTIFVDEDDEVVVEGNGTCAGSIVSALGETAWFYLGMDNPDPASQSVEVTLIDWLFLRTSISHAEVALSTEADLWHIETRTPVGSGVEESLAVSVNLNGQPDLELGTATESELEQFVALSPPVTFDFLPKPAFTRIDPGFLPVSGEFDIVVLGEDFRDREEIVIRLSHRVGTCSFVSTEELTCEFPEDGANLYLGVPATSGIPYTMSYNRRQFAQIPTRLFKFLDLTDPASGLVVSPVSSLRNTDINVTIVLPSSFNRDLFEAEDALLCLSEQEADNCALEENEEAWLSPLSQSTKDAIMFYVAGKPEGVYSVYIAFGTSRFPTAAAIEFYEPNTFEIYPKAAPAPVLGREQSRTQLYLVGQRFPISKQMVAPAVQFTNAAGDVVLEPAQLITSMAMKETNPVCTDTSVNGICPPVFFDASKPQMRMVTFMSQSMLREAGLWAGISFNGVDFDVDVPPSFNMIGVTVRWAWLQADTLTQATRLIDDGIAELALVNTTEFLPAAQAAISTNAQSCDDASSAGCKLSFTFPDEASQIWNGTAALVVQLTRTTAAGQSSQMTGSLEKLLTTGFNTLIDTSSLTVGGERRRLNNAESRTYRFLPSLSLHLEEPAFRASMPQVADPADEDTSQLQENWEVAVVMQDSTVPGVTAVPQVLGTQFTVFSNKLKMVNVFPHSGPRTGGTNVRISTNRYLVDSPMLSVRWRFLVQTQALGRVLVYLYTDGEYFSNEAGDDKAVLTQSPALPSSLVSVNGGTKALVDISLDGLTYVYDDIGANAATRISVLEYTFYDPGFIISASPLTFPQQGESDSSLGVEVTARNVFFQRNTLFCRFVPDREDPRVSRVDFEDPAPVLARIDSQSGFKENGTFSCAVPPHPPGRAELQFSNNGADGDFVGGLLPIYVNYTDCDNTTIAPHFTSECQPCPKGKQLKITPLFRSCVFCQPDQYMIPDSGHACQNCPNNSITAPGSEQTSRYDCLCFVGNYSLDVNWPACLACPQFSNCTGGWNVPEPLPGYWRHPICGEQRLVCEDKFYVCSPLGACPAIKQVHSVNATFNHNDTFPCAEGYDSDSWLCGECDEGYYRVNKHCVRCTGEWVAIFCAIIHLLMLFFVYFGYTYTTRVNNYAVLAVFAQTLISLSYADVYSGHVATTSFIEGFGSFGNWPTAFHHMFNVGTSYIAPAFFFYPNYFERLAGDCRENFPDPDFGIRWYLAMGALATQLFIVTGFFVGDFAYARLNPAKVGANGETVSKRVTPLMRYTNALALGFELNLIFILTQTIRYTTCTTQSDGTSYFDAAPSISCDDRDAGTGRTALIVVQGYFMLAYMVATVLLIRYTEKSKYFNFFHKRHRQHTKYWSLVIVARSVLFVGSSTLGHLVLEPREALGAYEAVVHMLIALISAGAHWFKRPYKDESANYLEQVTLAVTFVLSAIAMLFTMQRQTVLADFLEIMAPWVVLYIVLKGLQNLVNEMTFRYELLRLKSGARSFINFNDAIDQRLSFVSPSADSLASTESVALSLTVSGANAHVGALTLQTEQVLALVITESHDTAGTEHHMTTRSILAVEKEGEVRQLYGGPALMSRAKSQLVAAAPKRRSAGVDNAGKWRKAHQDSRELLLSVWGVGSPGDSTADALVREREIVTENVFWAGPISEATLFARQAYNVAFLADGLQDVDIVGLHHTMASHSFTRIHLDRVMRSMMHVFLQQQRKQIEKSGKDTRPLIMRFGQWIAKKFERVIVSGLVGLLVSQTTAKKWRKSIRQACTCSRGSARTMLQSYFDKLEDAVMAHWSARSVGLGVVDPAYDERTQVFGGEIKRTEDKLTRMGFREVGGEERETILQYFYDFTEWYLDASGERQAALRQARIDREKKIEELRRAAQGRRCCSCFRKRRATDKRDRSGSSSSKDSADLAGDSKADPSGSTQVAKSTVTRAELDRRFSRLLYLLTRGDFSFVTVPFLLKWMRHPEVSVALRQGYKDGMGLVDEYCRTPYDWRVVFDVDPAGYAPGGYKNVFKFTCSIIILDKFEKNIPGTDTPRDDYFLHGRFAPSKVGLWARAEPVIDPENPDKELSHPLWVGVEVSDLPSASEKYELNLWVATEPRSMPSTAQPRLVDAKHFLLRFSAYDTPCEVWAPSSYDSVPERMPDNLPMRLKWHKSKKRKRAAKARGAAAAAAGTSGSEQEAVVAKQPRPPRLEVYLDKLVHDRDITTKVVGKGKHL